MKSILNCLLFLLLSFNLEAQVLKNLKEAAVDVGKNLNTKENRDKLGSYVMKDLEKARKDFDSTDFDYAILLSDNAGLFDIREKGERSSKLSSLGGSAVAFLNNSELTDAERARFQLDMGEVAYASQKFAYAEKRFDAAKYAYERAGLKEDLGYLKTISNQGLLYATMGRFTQAELYTAEALDMRKAKFGDHHTGVAASKNNYGVLKFNLARYNEAEKDFVEATTIIKKNNLQFGMPNAIVLNNQAILFQAVGRYSEAEQVLKEAIAIAEKLQNNKSKNHLKFLSNLALLYQQMGKYSEAEAIYLTMEKRLGKNNPDYASMLNNHASLYMTMGKDDKVEDLLKKSATIYKSNFGESNPGYAKSISDLGNFFRYKTRYDDAAPLLNKALVIRESTLGINHPLYVQSQEDIAILNWKIKSWNSATQLYANVMSKSLDFITNYFPPMSEAEKTKYWDVLAPRFQRFYNFAIEASVENPGIAEQLYNYQIATKALLLSSTNKVKRAITASKDSQLIKDYVAWLDQKETLARLYAYSKEELKLQNINLDSLEQAANAMEKTLSQRSSDFSAQYVSKPIQYKKLQELLTDQEAMVEIIRIQAFDQKFLDDTKYAALILTKNTKVPKLIVLENGTQLETRYSNYYRNVIQQRITDDHSYDQYWARIEPALTGKKLIYFTPDGIYNQINLNTLKKTPGDYIVKNLDVVLLGNAKDLITLKNQKAKPLKKNATLIGFPEYGMGNLVPLPATKVEIEGIAKVLKTSGYNVMQFVQKNASEANVKAVKSPTIMHIATHGYFLQDIESNGSAFGVNLENANDNPLLRSGLMLTGAAATISGERMPNLQSNDNGILTAYEAMNLNLEETNLVVLSACETGLGDIKVGEGVYGLQRAFLVAGADAIIMSLWKVDDATTQQLMVAFYKYWLKLGNKQKAFKQAQLDLLAKSKEPYYWGAFVMVGM